MGKNKKTKSKRQSGQGAGPGSATDPASDTEQHDSLVTNSGDEALATATLTSTPPSASTTKPSEEGAGTSRPVSPAGTAGDETERPLLERLATDTTIDSLHSAPSGEKSGDADSGVLDDASGNAGSGTPSKSLAATDDEQPGGRGTSQHDTSLETLMESWKRIIENAQSRGTPSDDTYWQLLIREPERANSKVIATFGPQASECWEKIMALRAAETKNDEKVKAEESGGASHQSIQGETEEAASGAGTTEHVEEDPETGLPSDPEKADNARLNLSKESRTIEENMTENDNEEGEQTQESLLASLQKALEHERRKNKELGLELETFMRASTVPDQARLVNTNLGPATTRVQSLTTAADDGGSPVTVITDRRGGARALLSQRMHLLEPDTPVSRAISSVADYIDGVGERPGEEVLKAFGDFRDYTAQRVEVLEAALEDKDPLAAMQRLDDAWWRTVWGTDWSNRLDLRFAALRAILHLKKAKGTLQCAAAIRNFEDQLATVRERLGSRFSDQVVLQTQDILTAAAEQT